jgi:hypothetical protein
MSYQQTCNRLDLELSKVLKKIHVDGKEGAFFSETMARKNLRSDGDWVTESDPAELPTQRPASNGGCGASRTKETIWGGAQ